MFILRGAEKRRWAGNRYNTIDEIWQQRDSDYIMLLDNDFFVYPQWRDRIDEILRHRLKVNFSQGLNIRNLKPDQAAAIASRDVSQHQ